MYDKDKIAAELAKAVELMDVSVDTEISDQQRSNREAIMSNWSEGQAQQTAKEEGIELTDAHMNVVQLLRDFYHEYGEVKSGRELGDMLDKLFASEGGRKYLRDLFPAGPVAQGMRIAGLPVPPHSEDDGFGTTR
jgi:tRNA 2-thiouridine synthesizing protein E